MELYIWQPTDLVQWLTGHVDYFLMKINGITADRLFWPALRRNLGECYIKNET